MAVFVVDENEMAVEGQGAEGTAVLNSIAASLRVTGPGLLQQQLAAVQKQQQQQSKGIDDIAPKKGDADLKRLYAKRLEKLNKRTTR